jgi:hypothetical protein
MQALCRYEYDGDRIAKIVPLPRYHAMVRRSPHWTAPGSM